MKSKIKDTAKNILQLSSGDTIRFTVKGSSFIHLTIDDGPDEIYTPQILKILEEFNITADFFFIGEHMRKYPDIMEMFVEKKIPVHSHTFYHRLITEMNVQEFQKDSKQFNEIYRKYFGKDCFVLRPPLGKFRLKNIIWAKKTGMKIVHYSKTYEDWEALSRQTIIDRHHAMHFYPGDIILYHGQSQASIQALPYLIENLLERNFSFHQLSGI
jgi:peptidoglycan/xylan/chitin deacetylase (PgdA/CDA1 family)